MECGLLAYDWLCFVICLCICLVPLILLWVSREGILLCLKHVFWSSLCWPVTPITRKSLLNLTNAWLSFLTRVHTIYRIAPLVTRFTLVSIWACFFFSVTSVASLIEYMFRESNQVPFFSTSHGSIWPVIHRFWIDE